jgi:hypothetical protein
VNALRWENTLLSYVESRKRIFVPEYCKLLRNSREFGLLKQLVDSGISVLLLDNDGPSLEDFPTGMDVTVQSITNALEDESRIFGHGYLVAAMLAEIDVDSILHTHSKKQKTTE